MKKLYINKLIFGLIMGFITLSVHQGLAQTTIDIDEVGAFHLHPTQYGPAFGVGDTLSGEVLFLEDGSGGLETACESIAADLSGKFVVLKYIASSSDPDYCSSATKVANLQEAGAAAAIFVTTSNFASNYKDVNNIGEIPVFIVTEEEASDIIAGGSSNNTAADIYYFYEDFEDILWYEDFADGFNSPNGEWTSQNTAGADSMVWIYSPDAINHGWFRSFIIDAPTRANGVALMDNGAYLSDQGTFEPPFNSGYGDVGAELISPVIDLSDEGPITVKWWQYAAGLNNRGDSHVGFSYSTDGGITWSARKVIETKSTVNQGIVHNPEIIREFIPDAAGVEEFRFKIEFRSDLYMMMVDDIQIVRPAETDLVITEMPFYTPANYRQPSWAIEHDEFFFSVMVHNNGSEAQSNITLMAEIINLSDNSVIETIQGSTDLILPMNEEAELTIDETYFPVGLEPGAYKIRYTVIPEEEDAFPDNNSYEIQFSVSENSFSMTEENPTASSWYRSDVGNVKGVGNVFTIPAEVQENYQIGEITAAYRNPGEGDLSTKYGTILVTSVADDIDEDWGNWSYSIAEDPFNNSQMDQIAYQDIELAGTQEGEILSAPGNGFKDPFEHEDLQNIPLENGKRYIIWNLIADADLGIGLSSAYGIERSRTPFTYNGDQGRYYAYFTNGTQAVMDLNVQLVSTVDDIALPEETMNIYPNPVVSNQLFTELTFDIPTTATITIADMNGMVQSFETYHNVLEQTLEIHVGNLPAGTYLVRLATQDGSKTLKFIKQ